MIIWPVKVASTQTVFEQTGGVEKSEWNNSIGINVHSVFYKRTVCVCDLWRTSISQRIIIYSGLIQQALHFSCVATLCSFWEHNSKMSKEAFKDVSGPSIMDKIIIIIIYN